MKKKCFNNRRFWFRGKQLTQVLIDNGYTTGAGANEGCR
jgi:hypothetical protein